VKRLQRAGSDRRDEKLIVAGMFTLNLVSSLYAGVVRVERNGTRLTYMVGEMDGVARMRVPLHDNGAEFGALELGARKNGEAYSDADCQVVGRNAARVARALSLAVKTGELHA
jgi:hypothetical protein